MSTPVPPDDAQREMEQRALRNVRGLVDKMEDLDKVDAASQRRVLVAIVIAAVLVLAAVILYGVVGQKKPRGTPVELKLQTSPPSPPATPSK